MSRLNQIVEKLKTWIASLEKNIIGLRFPNRDKEREIFLLTNKSAFNLIIQVVQTAENAEQLITTKDWSDKIISRIKESENYREGDFEVDIHVLNEITSLKFRFFRACEDISERLDRK